MGELLGPLDDEIIILLQTFSPLLDFLFGLITVFGDELFIIGVIALFFCIDKDLAIRSAFLVIITSFITTAAKGFFGLSRPYIVNQAEIKGIPDILGQLPEDYTFPSGHSSNAGAIWTYLANKWRNPGFWVLAIFMIIFIPLSRSYLGVHWPTDIIIGTLLGIVIAILFTLQLPKVEEFMTRANSILIILIIILFPIIGVVISYMLTLGTGNKIEYADPSSMGGLLIGLSLGYMLENRYVNLRVEEYRSNKKVLVYRAIAGLIIILAVYFGLSALLGMLFEGFPLYEIGRFVRYAILAFVGIFCVPWLFVFIEQKLSLEPLE